MNNRREQLWVGTFVLIALIILIGTVLAVSGTFSRAGIPHRAYFKYAGGLAPGTPVRYGGLSAGRVEALAVDPQDSTRIEMTFSLAPEIPLKTDSMAKIASLGVLGESYLELTTGTKDAPLAPPGSIVNSKELVGIGDLGDMISGLAPSADKVLQSLNQRLTELKITVAEANDLLGDQNRKNISGGLGHMNEMLAENRPKISATLDNVQAASNRLQPVLQNVQAASDRLAPMLDDLKATIKQANEALAHIDGLIVDNRPEIQPAILEIRRTLSATNEFVTMLKTTVARNMDNMDITLEIIRATTENMRELTDALKRNPSLLVRGDTGKDRQPGDKK
jgi:phospholipid/cholesterol/gamma-HCH transport system substrate-binding protein